MATGTISPSPYGQEIDANGDPISGALIYTYLAGTSTAATTWTTVNVSGGSAVPNTNPIVADSAGRWVAFLQNGVSYKYVFCLPVSPIPPPSSPPSAYKTVDNISAPGSSTDVDITGVIGEPVIAPNLLYLSNGSGGKTAGKWYLASSLNAYSSTTPEMGFAVTDGTTNDTIPIRQAGQVPGLSGLVAGAPYYAGVAGAVTSSPSTSARFVGQADSTTSLIASPNPPPLSNFDNGVCDFRLTLTTSVPVTVTDVTGAVTIFCAPYKGNRIALYDGTGIATIVTSAQFSIAVPATTNQMYDVFCYNNAGVATLELLAWTSDTARATNIVTTTTGAYTKSGDLTRRYLGSFRTTGVSGQTEDSAVKRYLWNYYNRVHRLLRVADSATSWNYSTATWRQANANTANQVDVVVGVAETLLELACLSLTINNNANWQAGQAIGEDATSAGPPSDLIYTSSPASGEAAGVPFAGLAKLDKYPAIGRHFYAWIEYSVTGATTTFFGTNTGALFTTGLNGWISG